MKELKQEDYCLTLVKDLGMQYATPTTIQPKRYALFLCNTCKNEFRAAVSSIKTGNTKGCYECSKRSEVTHGQTHVKGYKRWEGMIARCTQPSNKHYHRYGGRGITVCEEWLTSPKGYIDYITSLPNAFKEGYTVDRRDNSEGYYPGNLRWASDTTQAANNENGTHGKSKYKGVTWDKISGRWKVRLMVNKVRVLIGYYQDEVTAALAYDSYIESIGLQDKIKNKDIYEDIRNITPS